MTILDPLEENGFYFDTSKHILNVDCPIMMLHADDDTIVPCFLGKKVLSFLFIYSILGLPTNVVGYELLELIVLINKSSKV